jgi:hypothetical protein
MREIVLMIDAEEKNLGRFLYSAPPLLVKIRIKQCVAIAGVFDGAPDRRKRRGAAVA